MIKPTHCIDISTENGRWLTILIREDIDLPLLAPGIRGFFVFQMPRN